MKPLKPLAAAVLLALATPAFAQLSTPEIDQHKQQIEQDRAAGRITEAQAAELRKGVVLQQHEYGQAQADGTLTDAERRRLDRSLEEQRRNLANARTVTAGGKPNAAARADTGATTGTGTTARSTASASADAGFKDRDTARQVQIDRAVASGRLTKQEEARLETRQAEIRDMHARARADGTFTAEERARIQAAEQRQEADIAKQRGDAATRQANATPASNAQPGNNVTFKDRDTRRQERIDKGVASGQLTKKEEARLETRQAEIRDQRERARADGTVTAEERARLQAAQKQQAAAIAKQRKDEHERKQ